MKTIRGKLALVTGASSGIGEAIALRLAQEGASVLLTARDAQRLDEVRRRCEGAGASAWAMPADLTDETQVRALAEAVHAKHPAVDILVNNAGVVMAGLLVDVEPADWRRVHEINVMGVVHGCRAFLPAMIQRGAGGQVVNIASASGIVGTPGMSTYCASKFAVVGLSESLRAEVGRHGIGVSVICPGYVDTPIAGKVKLVGALATERRREQIAARFKGSLTAGQVAAATVGAIRRNPAIAPVGREARLAYYFKRVAPALLERFAR